MYLCNYALKLRIVQNSNTLFPIAFQISLPQNLDFEMILQSTTTVILHYLYTHSLHKFNNFYEIEHQYYPKYSKVSNKHGHLITELPICGALCDLVPLVQFKRREKHP